MVRNFWRKLVFEKQLKRRLEQKQIDLPFKVKKIAVVADATIEVDTSVFLNLGSDFNLSEAQITVLFFNSDLASSKQNQNVLDPKEIDYWSNFKGELLSFCENEYDLIINYFNSNDLLNNLISVRVNHKFSVGFSGSDERINDLIFDFDPKEMQTFKKELVKYMHVLNKI